MGGIRSAVLAALCVGLPVGCGGSEGGEADTDTDSSSGSTMPATTGTTSTSTTGGPMQTPGLFLRGPSQLLGEELPEQSVVTVLAPVGVEGHGEQVGRLEAG